MGKIKIAVAGDWRLVRQAVRALLESDSGFVVVGETECGLQGVQLVERLKPQVLVVDLIQSCLAGLVMMRQITKRFPRTRLVILSKRSEQAHAAEALRMGAAGYVLENSSATDLYKAVREAVAGRRYVSPTLSLEAIESYMQRSKELPADPYQTLTLREREVLELAAEGLRNADIAVRLSISPRTVEVHRAHMMRKLGLRNRIELVRYAIRRGILSVEDNSQNRGRRR